MKIVEKTAGKIPKPYQHKKNPLLSARSTDSQRMAPAETQTPDDDHTKIVSQNRQLPTIRSHATTTTTTAAALKNTKRKTCRQIRYKLRLRTPPAETNCEEEEDERISPRLTSHLAPSRESKPRKKL